MLTRIYTTNGRFSMSQTAKVLTQAEIEQLKTKRQTATQDKATRLKCVIRDEQGKVKATNSNTNPIRIILYSANSNRYQPTFK